MRARLAAASAIVLVSLLPAGTPALRAQGSLPQVPPTLAGLTVSVEDVAPPQSGGRPQLLEEIRLYGLRGPDERLEATLQLGRLRAGDDVESTEFRRAVAGRVGDTVPVRQRVAGQSVYVSRSKQLSLVVWFRGSTMAVLSIRSEATTPKAIIRAALEVGQ